MMLNSNPTLKTSRASRYADTSVPPPIAAGAAVNAEKGHPGSEGLGIESDADQQRQAHCHKQADQAEKGLRSSFAVRHDSSGTIIATAIVLRFLQRSDEHPWRGNHVFERLRTAAQCADTASANRATR